MSGSIARLNAIAAINTAEVNPEISDFDTPIDELFGRNTFSLSVLQHCLPTGVFK